MVLSLQVASLKEELEKECMYVEYLERLLNDIELRRYVSNWYIVNKVFDFKEVRC